MPGPKDLGSFFICFSSGQFDPLISCPTSSDLCSTFDLVDQFVLSIIIEPSCTTDYSYAVIVSYAEVSALSVLSVIGLYSTTCLPENPMNAQ